MFPFSRESNDPQPAPDSPARPAAEAHPLDALTGGVFSAATSGERAQRVRDWLASGPTPEQMQEVFKELSAKDKGAARALRERLDELRRAKGQEAVAAEWAAKAQALLQAARLNIADALAWQRDAAKAGAPLSREPLAGLRTQLAQRIKVVEDLQQRVMVQREAAILLAQRIELLSTKPWQDAQAQQIGLAADVAQWRQQAAALLADAQWPSVDLRFPPQMEAAQTQLSAVWDAFGAALAQAQAAAADAAAPLPSVPVWADELRAARGEAPAAAAEADKPARPRIDPEQRAAAHKAVEAGVMLLEQAVTAGHTKNMHSATQALRQSLKTHGRLIDDALEARVHAVLVSAGELEGWQRWSADKLREQLVARAEALLVKRRKKAPAQGAPDAAPAPSQAESGQASATEPTTVPAAPEASASPAAPEQTAPEGQPDAIENGASGADPASAGAENDAEPAARPLPATTLAADEQWVPAMGGRKLQEAIRKLRDEWKAADQGGPPNHALWKRFDRAVSTAHAFVDEWIAGVRAQAAEHKAQREALIDEVRAWAASHADAGEGGDWKAVNRQIHQFAERWRNAGHLSEKQFAELQPRWKEAIHAAALPLENMQKHSTARRQALIQEAEALGAAPQLRIDAVRALQQRWQAEAQAVPLDRKHEQKLWDAFRKPIDEAFNRKSAEREKAQAAMSAHDRAVLEAAKALEAANASGDAQRIRAAMAQLEAATRAQPAPGSEEKPAAAPADSAPEAIEIEATEAPTDAPDAPAEGAAPAPAPKPAKPLVAMRGDDRPGARKAEPAPAGRPGERRPAGRDGRAGDRREGAAGRAGERGARRFDDARGPRRSDEARGPRLGDAAFRAQRDAVEQAQAQLRKLAAQAHGEALTQLLGAWQARQPDQVPGVQELGRGVTPALRNAWTQAIGGGAGAPAAEALLRLEMAAEVPTPAEHLQARRALQLQLLTRRNDPSPVQTWGQDTAAVLAGPHDDATARRLQTALKGLLRK